MAEKQFLSNGKYCWRLDFKKLKSCPIIMQKFVSKEYCVARDVCKVSQPCILNTTTRLYIKPKPLSLPLKHKK